MLMKTLLHFSTGNLSDGSQPKSPQETMDSKGKSKHMVHRVSVDGIELGMKKSATQKKLKAPIDPSIGVALPRRRRA